MNFLELSTIDERQLKKVFFPISVNKFFDLLFSDNAYFSLADHFKKKGTELKNYLFY